MNLFGAELELRIPKLWEGQPLLPIEGTSNDLIYTLVMFAFLGLGSYLFLHARRRQKWRRLIQTLSAIAFVIGIHPCFCMLRNVLRGVQFLSRDNLNAFALLMLFSLVVAFSLVFGRVFCGWVCPLGFFQELSAMTVGWTARGDPRRVRVGKYVFVACVLTVVLVAFLALKPARYVFTQSTMVFWALALLLVILFVISDPALHRGLTKLRYVSLAAIVALYVVGTYFNMPGCVLYCSIDDPSSVLSAAGIILAAVALASAWCRYLCPEGALLGLCAKHSRWSLVRKDGCTQCGSCAKACPVQAITPDGADRDATACLSCAKCIDECPEDCWQVEQRDS